MDVHKLKVELVPIDSLHEDPANPRQHTPRNIEVLEASLSEFNQVEPLLVQKSTRRIIAGHERRRRMKQLGATHCNVIYLDVDATTATRMAIALNRAGELGEWNESLADQLKALKDDGFDLTRVGFTDDEFDAVLSAIAPELPPEAQGREFDESIADKTKMLKCPSCGHEFPA